MSSRSMIQYAIVPAFVFSSFHDTSAALGQATFQAPRGQSVSFVLTSGLIDNRTAAVQLAFRQTVRVEDASWIRLYFSSLDLSDGGRLRVTSALDGEIQELDADDAAAWGNSTAYFNGDTVILELLTAPGSSHNGLTMDHVDVEYASQSQQFGSGGQCGICGTDDRVPSNEPWSGRLMPVGCTASVYNQCGCLVSAGHCVSSGMVVQFNVPNSQSNCSIVNPPVADQFPITSYQYAAVDIGNDWSVLKTGTNNLGQKPFDRYGAMRPISAVPATVGSFIEIWSYGIDNNCVNSQRQQYSSGQVNVVAPTTIQFSADLRTGASGTGLIRNGSIIGVVTNCMEWCPNVATAINLPSFAAARANLCACTGAIPCPADVNGDHRIDVDDLVLVLTHWGWCPNAPSTCTGDVALLAPFGSVDMSDLTLVITSWGNCP